MNTSVKETERSLYFNREIRQGHVKIQSVFGWIWITEEISAPRWWCPWRKETKLHTYTTEDARNLVTAIQALLPQEDPHKAEVSDDKEI